MANPYKNPSPGKSDGPGKQGSFNPGGAPRYNSTDPHAKGNGAANQARRPATTTKVKH